MGKCDTCYGVDFFWGGVYYYPKEVPPLEINKTSFANGEKNKLRRGKFFIFDEWDAQRLWFPGAELGDKIATFDVPSKIISPENCGVGAYGWFDERYISAELLLDFDEFIKAEPVAKLWDA